MNTRMIAYSVGRIFQIQSLLFLLPLIVSLYYGEVSVWVWVLCSGITFLAGKLMSLREPEKTDLYSKDGLLIVSLVWVSLALTCALPYLPVAEDFLGLLGRLGADGPIPAGE